MCGRTRHASLHYWAGYSWLQQAAVAQHVTSFGFTCDAAAGTTSRSSAVVIGVSEAGRGAACVCMSGDAGALGGPMGGRASVCASVGNSSETHECAAIRHASLHDQAGYIWLRQAAVTQPHHPPPLTHIHRCMTSFGLTCNAVLDTSSRLPSLLVVGDKAVGSTCV